MPQTSRQLPQLLVTPTLLPQHLHNQTYNLHQPYGKMNAYSLIIFTCCICKYTSVEIMPELKKNIIKLCCSVNFKYVGMLAHSFDRFYVVTKLILPTVKDLNFTPIDFNEECKYISDDLMHDCSTIECISNLKIYCKKVGPFMHYYKEQIYSYNHTALNILMNEKSLISPKFQKAKVEKRSLIASLISHFISLAYEGISSF